MATAQLEGTAKRLDFKKSFVLIEAVSSFSNIIVVEDDDATRETIREVWGKRLHQKANRHRSSTHFRESKLQLEEKGAQILIS